ncbi:MAG: CbiQ family ECF transporter T component [Methylophilaceae bacterium]
MHPTVKIIYLIALAVTVHLLPPQELATLAVLTIVLLIYYKAINILKMLTRMRWLFLTMMVIYAFSTPGEYVPDFPFEIGPTYEGLCAAMVQASRLSIMLAGLALLLTTTTRESLMVGFYVLLLPLKYFGLSPERFAARLWLTLHYVDHPVAVGRGQGVFERLRHMQFDDETNQQGPETITLDLPALTWRDGLALVTIVLVGMYVL